MHGPDRSVNTPVRGVPGTIARRRLSTRGNSPRHRYAYAHSVPMATRAPRDPTGYAVSPTLCLAPAPGGAFIISAKEVASAGGGVVAEVGTQYRRIFTRSIHGFSIYRVALLHIEN